MKKISVIVPCYGTEEYVEKCIESIFKQSYKNLEIIAINDCSKKGMKEILDRLAQKDNRLIVLENEENIGLFHTRIIGSKEATGDYISFVDSDDYLDVDYYRLLIENAEKHNSDIVIANYVRNEKGKLFVNGLQFNLNNPVYEGEEFYQKYFQQAGRIIRYHMLCTKLMKMDIWHKTTQEMKKMKERLLMTEDFAFSTIALYYAKKVSFCDGAIYYYTINENQSTSVAHLDEEKINHNVNDIRTIFSFIKDFLKEKKCLSNFQENLEEWKNYYLSMHINQYLKLKEKKKDIKPLDFDYESDESYQSFLKNQEDPSRDNYFQLQTEYTEELSELKKQIMDENIKVVSFDMFDTLVVRPFFEPLDMFQFLNELFTKTFSTMGVIDFSRIREKSEAELRNIKFSKNEQEVTLEEIYDYISETYQLDRKQLRKIQDAEEKMEIHFCYQRKTGHELYQLAKYLKKRVILTTDIYLPREVLLKILEKNDYQFDEYFISSEIKKTKANGSLYEYIKEKEHTSNILHIGDNYESDHNKAKEHGIEAGFLPKATLVMMGYSNNIVRYCGTLYKHFVSFNIDHIPFIENIGVRCSLGLVANYYFDNPFRPFNEYSDFNGDPTFIGYYALGMQTLSMCNWILNDMKTNSIDSVAFMARDGYLPYKAIQIVNEKIKAVPKAIFNYTYVSRKSLMPLLLKDKIGVSMIDTYVNFDMVAPKDLLKTFAKVLTVNEKKEKELNKEFPLDEIFKTKDELNRCALWIYDHCFDQKKYDEYYKMCKEYFDEQFVGNAATFDVGYSGKPEAILTNVLEKPITTYFIHTNSSIGFKNAKMGGFRLKTFYEFKPTLTGTTRELFISYIGPSCIGYEYQDKKVVPVFGSNKNYNYFNKDMIEKIQQGALDYVSDFCHFFGDYIDRIDLNKYYLSIPLEYYYHYAQMEDRLPFKDLLFEDNVNNMVELNDFIFNVYKKYAKEYSIGSIPVKLQSNIEFTLPNSRIKRVAHYVLHDRRTLLKKIKRKLLK